MVKQKQDDLQYQVTSHKNYDGLCLLQMFSLAKIRNASICFRYVDSFHKIEYCYDFQSILYIKIVKAFLLFDLALVYIIYYKKTKREDSGRNGIL